MWRALIIDQVRDTTRIELLFLSASPHNIALSLSLELSLSNSLYISLLDFLIVNPLLSTCISRTQTSRQDDGRRESLCFTRRCETRTSPSE
jgi:hypothetical protein